MRCVEYIVVHEMAHFTERGHGERFQEILDKHMPDWRRRAEELNRADLAHEQWESARSAK